MKRLIFLILVNVLVFSAAQAQFKVGVKGGPSLATYRGTASKMDYIVGYNLGVFANFAFTDNISFQPEILFSRQGAKIDGFYEPELLNIQIETTYKDQLNYLTIPLLVKLNTSFGLNFESGFQLGYLVKGTTRYEFINNNTNFTLADLDLKEAEIVKNGDFSFLIGAGFEIPSGLSINFRSVIGLANIGQNSEYYNLGFQLALGFPLISL